MAIFRQKIKDDVVVDDTVTEESAEAIERTVESQNADSLSQIETPGSDDTPGRLPRPHQVDRTDGPFDVSEVESLESRLDFGSIAIVPEAAMELRFDADDTGQEITGMTVIQGDSACQLQVFAAPKTSGVWDSIRDEIADNLISGGGTAEEKLGPLGIELHARMPCRGSDERTIYAPARFLGVDGPRWFLRAVLSGNAALDDAAGESLIAVIRRTVVIRGTEARAPRELLLLQIPNDVAVVDTKNASETIPTDDRSDTVNNFKSFERRPEIIEVR